MKLATPALIASALALLTCAGPAFARRDGHASPLRRVSAPAEAEVPEAPRPKAWVAAHLPPGGSLDHGVVVHTVKKGESLAEIAEAYLDLTGVYDATDLAKAIVRENDAKRGVSAGMKLRIPSVLEAPPRRAPIGLPADGVVKGIYVRGSSAAGRGYERLLDRVAAHGMNAIVLDVKDYDGLLTYPSKVPLAVESGAVHKPPIRSYARAVQFAHQRGISVIARVSCFNDQHMAKAHPGMAIRGISGHPYRNGWVDPQNERAQEYAVDLAKEAIAAGADEVQLDYVRYPVIGMKNIDFKLDTRKDPNAKVEVITRFVQKVHDVTRARNVPLSLDVFGVIAFGKQVDIQNLGQDPARLAEHSEFLSAMVYPSHYDPGFMGLEEPANHPELVGLGTKHMAAGIAESGVKRPAKLRPWLQAMRHMATNYGAAYIQEEIRTGEKAGAQGWLLWNPGQVYDVAWSALPAKKKDVALTTAAAAPHIVRARAKHRR